MNKLKKLFRKLFSLNFYFTLFTIGEIIISLVVASLIASAVGIDIVNSPFTNFLICAVCVDAGLAILINSFFLKPIGKLCESM